jgi:siroheme synthase-like protein
MLRLDGKKCLVVGGGQVATRKVQRLAATGAEVTVVAPDLSPELAAMVASGRVGWEQRAYQKKDLDGAALVFAATDRHTVNAAVGRDCEQSNIPVNLADDPVGSTFQVPAVVERQDLLLAISTGGRSPAFARQLRQELERALSPERLELLELYAELRDEWRRTGRPTTEAAWETLDEQALSLLRRGRRAEARQLLFAQVLAPVGEG